MEKFKTKLVEIPDMGIKAGDRLTILKPIYEQKINEYTKIRFVFAEGVDFLGNKVTRKLLLSTIKTADGNWIDDCWMFGIFDRPFYVAKIVHYPMRKYYTFDRI